MKIRKDFSIVNKDKIIFYSIALVLALACLGNFIATSFGTFDDKMSSIFYKAMDISFFRGWSGYTVMEGYIEIMAYCLPSALVLIEVVWMWVKKYKPNWWISQHISLYKYVIVAMGILFEVLIVIMYYFFNYADNGFSKGYNIEFVIGKEFTIPSYIVSLVIANIVFWTLVWWFHFKLAKRKDFLQLKIWRPMLTSLFYLAVGYIVVQFTKQGLDRPYWYDIHFTDGLKYGNIDYSSVTTPSGYHVVGPLERFRERYHDAFEYYINNKESNWGWNTKASGSVFNLWPDSYTLDGKTYTGLTNWKWQFKDPGLPFWGGGAFPSGHMIATVYIALAPTYIFVATSKSRKYNAIKWSCYALGLIYILDMIFALQVSSSHWWSDSMFSVGFGIAFYGIAWGISHGFCAACNKIFKTKNY